MVKNIELYMISGFLGCGKTTFLKQMMDGFSNKKVGILVNEIGQISVDTQRVNKDDVEIVEITNGSIYCACLKGNFMKALMEFSKSDIEVLIIENSGMADPANIHRILEELKQHMVHNFQYKGSVCIVDAVSFLKYVRVLNSITNQVLSSDYILVNKKDLVDEIALSQIHSKLAQINPNAKIYDTVYAQIPIEQVIASVVDNAFDDETSNKCYNKPLSLVLQWEDKVNEEALQKFIQKFMTKTYRMKGLFWSEKGLSQIDVVDEFIQFYVLEKTENQTSKLVMIFKEQNVEIKEVKQIWNQICKTSLTILS